MRSDVSHTTTLAGTLRIRPPGRLGIALPLRQLAQPTLRIFYIHFADLAKHPVAHHRFGLLDHRVSGIRMRQTEQQTRLLEFGLQLLRLIQRKRDRLFDDHMETMVQRHHRRSEMGEIRRHDRHEIHALPLGKQALLADHLLIGEIGPVFRQEQHLARSLSDLRIDAESTTDQFNQSVHVGRDPVDGSDESILASANHAHSEFTIHTCRMCCVMK